MIPCIFKWRQKYLNSYQPIKTNGQWYFFRLIFYFCLDHTHTHNFEQNPYSKSIEWAINRLIIIIYVVFAGWQILQKKTPALKLIYPVIASYRTQIIYLYRSHCWQSCFSDSFSLLFISFSFFSCVYESNGLKMRALVGCFI